MPILRRALLSAVADWQPVDGTVIGDTEEHPVRRRPQGREQAMSTTIAVGPGARLQGSPGVWTMDAVRGLGTTTDVETAGAILGIGRTKAYSLVKAGQFPVRVLRIGRRYLVPIPAILKLLGIE